MSEIKTEIKRNADGSYTITDAHSTADIVRWLLTQDSKETILYLLEGGQSKREWVGLTDEDKNEITWGKTVYEILDLAEAKLKEKNT